MAQLSSDGAPTVRSLCKDFRPTPSSLLDTTGKLIARHTRAETFADYPANQFWKAPIS